MNTNSDEVSCEREDRERALVFDGRKLFVSEVKSNSCNKMRLKNDRIKFSKEEEYVASQKKCRF